MNNSDSVYRAISDLADDKGYCRVRIDNLVGITHLSRATVRRALTDLVSQNRIKTRSRPGPTGGLDIRVDRPQNPAQNSAQNSAQNEPNRDVVTQGTPPSGAKSPAASANSAHSAHSAQRTLRPHEIPESGATLGYVGVDDDKIEKWKRLTKTLFIAPNGDAVSVRSMTPSLRRALGVDQLDPDRPNRDALQGVRSILRPEDPS